jgi:hypothetical protein
LRSLFASSFFLDVVERLTGGQLLGLREHFDEPNLPHSWSISNCSGFPDVRRTRIKQCSFPKSTRVFMDIVSKYSNLMISGFVPASLRWRRR